MKQVIMVVLVIFSTFAQAETPEQSFCRSQSEFAEKVAITRDKGIGRNEINGMMVKHATTLSTFSQIGAALYLSDRVINYVFSKPGYTPNEVFNGYYTICEESRLYQQINDQVKK